MPNTNPIPPPKTNQRPQIRLNWEDWLPYLEDWDAPVNRKCELIETLSLIVDCFVDLGWGLADPQESCGQSLDLTAALRAAVLNSECNGKEEA